MSVDNASVISSAVSVSGIESLSDDGSTFGVGADTLGTPGQTGTSENNLFDLGDGDLRIVVGKTSSIQEIRLYGYLFP